MKRRSEKQQAYLDQVQWQRIEWAQSKPQICMACGDKGDWRGLNIHEIQRRSHAQRDWHHPCNLLLICVPCHEGPLATMPHVEQLAIKWQSDREDYDLSLWLEKYDPAVDRDPTGPQYVTQEEVEDAADFHHL